MAVLGVSPPLTGQTSSEGVRGPLRAVFGGGGGGKSSPSAPDAGKTSQNHQEQRENAPVCERFRAVLRVSPLLTWFGPSKNVLGPLRAFFGGLRTGPGGKKSPCLPISDRLSPWEALDVRISPAPAGPDLVGRRRNSDRRSPKERRSGADRPEFRGAGGRRDRQTALRGALSASFLPRSGRNPPNRRFPARQAPGWPRSPRSRAAPGPSWGFARGNQANLGAGVTDRGANGSGSRARSARLGGEEKKTWAQRGGYPSIRRGAGGPRRKSGVPLRRYRSSPCKPAIFSEKKFREPDPLRPEHRDPAPAPAAPPISCGLAGPRGAGRPQHPGPGQDRISGIPAASFRISLDKALGVVANGGPGSSSNRKALSSSP